MGWARLGLCIFVCFNTVQSRAMPATTISILILYTNIINILYYLILFTNFCPSNIKFQ
jgi:hypothetical protein